MCGNVGVLCYKDMGIGKWDYDLFYQLLYADALRGMHGTGVLAIDKDADTYMTKVGGPPHQLTSSEEYEGLEKFVDHRRVRFLLGHNRYATRGQKTTAHAHPFKHGNIFLFHNGTLDDYHHFPEPEKGKFIVDSEHFCYSIDKIGIEKTIQKLRGAWAIIYWNKKDKTLSILRNKERTLYIAQDDDLIVYSSEENMLRWVLERNHYYALASNIKELPVDQLTTFSLNKSEPKTSELKGKASFVVENIQKVYELYGEKVDLSGNDEKTSKVVDITPYQKGTSVIPSHPASRAPTGYVAAAYSKRKKSEKTHIQVQSIHDLVTNKAVNVELSDYDTLATSKAGGMATKTFLAIFSHFQYPDIEFRAYISGETLLDRIIESRCGISGRISNILKSNTSTAENPHLIFLQDIAIVEDPILPDDAHIDGE